MSHKIIEDAKNITFANIPAFATQLPPLVKFAIEQHNFPSHTVKNDVVDTLEGVIKSLHHDVFIQPDPNVQNLRAKSAVLSGIRTHLLGLKDAKDDPIAFALVVNPHKLLETFPLFVKGRYPVDIVTHPAECLIG